MRCNFLCVVPCSLIDMSITNYISKDCYIFTYLLNNLYCFVLSNHR